MSVQTPSTIRIEFDLGAEDLAYFRDQLANARKALGVRDDAKVLAQAEALIAEATKSKSPRYVLERVAKLQTMIDMLKDDDWKLSGEDRDRVCDAMAYFSDPNDMIPDRIPGIGFLDDAIMIELVAVELEPELAAYADFCANREDLAAGEQDADPIEVSRAQLQARMRRRRRRRRAKSGGSEEIVASLFQVGG